MNKCAIQKKPCKTCGKKYEIKNVSPLSYGPFRVMRELNGVKVHVVTGHGSWNSHDLCPDCIIGVIQNNTVRPPIIYMSGRVNHTVFFHEHEYTKCVLTGGINLDDVDSYHL